MKRAFAGALLCAIAGLGPGAAPAEQFPARPIRFIVPSPPGGGTDIIARNLAQKFIDRAGFATLVENKIGAGSLIGTDYVAKAPPDGYTLMVGGLFNMVMNSALIKDLPYDPVRDFTPVGTISAYPFLLTVRPDMPVSTLAEFVAFAKERPGKLNYGSAGLGTLQHVWGTILVKSLGLDMVHVPYKGAAAAQQDLMAGRIDMMFDNLSAAKQYVESGRSKALAVSSAQRTAQLPDVPTIDETGLAKFEGESWFGLFAPAATPAPVIEVLRRALDDAIRDPDFAARIQRDGGRVLAIAPADQPKFLASEVQRWVALVHKYVPSAD
ncbi:MAG TPA: tripartite tricarboxylate transporter substrate binding protein [Alphaproteobacteria bacterium]|nr:tripartite tricarboxylate transporter substrate binding protein [Alphaproteobacteria bacterium]